MNIGVYVAAGPNPIFLRLFMLQILRQTRLPNFLAIYENGNATSAFDWACGEVVRDLKARGVNILHQHSPKSATYIKRYFEPLKTLLHKTESDVILKMDLDDFYADSYIEHTASMLGWEDGHPVYDWAINNNSNITLIRPYHGDFKFKKDVVMKYSPLGAAPTHVAFNRAFGNKYLGFLAGFGDREDAADDEVMVSAIEGMRINRVDGPADYTYVSHGNNQSSYAWQCTGGRIYF